MKQLLLASTALVATAGFAAADVTLTGSAEMGIKGNSEQDRSEFHTDIDVDFALSGESDNGISFGAEVDIDEVNDQTPTDENVDYTVFISAGSATLTMGDTDGAYDARLAETGGPAGSIADDHTSHAGFSGDGGFSAATAGTPAITIDETALGADVNGDGDALDTAVVIEAATAGTDDGGFGLDGANDGQIARFDYTFTGVTLSISTELDDADDGESPVWGIGVSYETELAGLTLGVGLAHQSQEDFAKVTGISVSTTFDNGISAVLKYGQQEFEDDITVEGETDDTATHFGIGFGYTMNALSIGVNYGAYSVGGEEVQSGFGLAVNYDLGGGLVAQFGYGGSDYKESDSQDQYSLGLAMSF